MLLSGEEGGKTLTLFTFGWLPQKVVSTHRLSVCPVLVLCWVPGAWSSAWHKYGGMGDFRAPPHFDDCLLSLLHEKDVSFELKEHLGSGALMKPFGGGREMSMRVNCLVLNTGYSCAVTSTLSPSVWALVSLEPSWSLLLQTSDGTISIRQRSFGERWRDRGLPFLSRIFLGLLSFVLFYPLVPIYMPRSPEQGTLGGRISKRGNGRALEFSSDWQHWVFIGRADVEAETPVLWPPHAKSWLIGKDPDAGRDWGQEEEGTTEDEMAGWHHQLDRREFESTPGVGDGQGGLACCSSWGRKE